VEERVSVSMWKQLKTCTTITKGGGTQINCQLWQQSDNHSDNYKYKILLTVLGKVSCTCKLCLHHHVTAWFLENGFKDVLSLLAITRTILQFY